jgi:hypothetical protein
MFSKVYSFFGGLVEFVISVEKTVEHDVEAIIANFTDTATKLEAAAAAKRDEAIDLNTQADALKTASLVAHAASDKARAVAAKIKDLVA